MKLERKVTTSGGMHRTEEDQSDIASESSLGGQSGRHVQDSVSHRKGTKVLRSD